MNWSTPGLPVHHQLLEFTETHVHQVGDAIQPSNPLLSPSPSALNPSQNQSLPMSQLFAWGGQSTGVSALASVLPKSTQDWSPLESTGWNSLQSKGFSRVFSDTTVQKHQFFGTQLSSQSNSQWPHGLQPTRLLRPWDFPGKRTVHHQLLEFTQTHVHWVGDAIQASHPLSSPSLPAFNLSQQQGLFKWVSSSHQVAKVLEFQLQHQSFQWTLRTDLL